MNQLIIVGWRRLPSSKSGLTLADSRCRPKQSAAARRTNASLSFSLPRTSFVNGNVGVVAPRSANALMVCTRTIGSRSSRVAARARHQARRKLQNPQTMCPLRGVELSPSNRDRKMGMHDEPIRSTNSWVASVRTVYSCRPASDQRICISHCKISLRQRLVDRVLFAGVNDSPNSAPFAVTFRVVEQNLHNGR